MLICYYDCYSCIVCASESKNSGSLVSSNCTACPDYTLTCECTIGSADPGGIVIWKGSAFDCPFAGNSIILVLSTLFMSSEFHETMLLSCNNGAITGWSVGWENNSFTSHLNISVSSDIFEMDIICAYDDGRGKSVTIGSSTLIQNIPGANCSYLILSCCETLNPTMYTHVQCLKYGGITAQMGSDSS